MNNREKKSKTEKNSKLNRRQFLKKLCSAYAVAVAGPMLANSCKKQPAEILEELPVTWSKAPCRFCGVGCGVMVGVANNKIVAIAGDKNNPVNSGLLCVKGYHLGEVLYGEDRYRQAFIRKNGKLQPAPLSAALDLIAERFKSEIAQNGPDSVALYGSGQWTIQDGYVATKWMRGGIGSNNIEANARLCMASAVTGFKSTFGLDEPMGCYDDLDQGNVFVLWGNNMAETHPVLFSRIIANRKRNRQVKVVDLTLRESRTSAVADMVLKFAPQSDLAIANAIAHEIVFNQKFNSEFINRYAAFKTGSVNIGYGREGEKPPPIKSSLSSFADYRNFLKKYTPEYAAEISGVPVEQIRELAALYSNPKTKVVSLWCMGVNQHTRGTWMNNLIYNLHLLTGKISEPGSGPFSLTGQPSACGTVREVGTLAHALPGGRAIAKPEDRNFAEQLWGVKKGSIPARIGAHTMEMFRQLKAGKIRAIWIQVTNPLVTLPDQNKFLKGIQKHKPFIVVSDVYPTPTTAIADVILPAAMWVEREGCFGNSERRTQQWDQLVSPPGDAKPDSWLMIEVARRMGMERLFPVTDEKEQAHQLYSEYRQFTLGRGKDLATYDELKNSRGMRWPVINGRETRWRYRAGEDPYVKGGAVYSFYGNKSLQNRAVIWQRPFEPAPETPDEDYPFWLSTGRVLEQWHTGSMTRRIPQLHQAMPAAYVELNSVDADRLQIKNGDDVRLTTRRGQLELPALINGRARPEPGIAFVPFFDEEKLINLLTLDVHCPISKQPDYKKCAVRVERA